MEKEAILRILQEDIHSTIAATLGEDGHPQTRAIDIMLIEDGKPIFLTARGKAFYDQLTTQKFIALSGVKAGISVSLRGQVRPADPGLLDLAFERNPYICLLYTSFMNCLKLPIWAISSGSKAMSARPTPANCQ